MKTLTENYYFDTTAGSAACKIGVRLTELLLKSDKSLDDVVILCIGTDRSTGDSLGPIVGYKLLNRIISDSRRLTEKGITVYGTLDSPVHAINLEHVLSDIERRHDKPFCIAVDASLGTKSHIGYVTVGTGPLRPGLGVNKQLPRCRRPSHHRHRKCIGKQRPHAFTDNKTVHRNESCGCHCRWSAVLSVTYAFKPEASYLHF